jgi:OmpA-OmpF porin, OOP family
MTTDTADRSRRSRRLILACGGVTLVGLFVMGAVVQVPAMEDELTASAAAALDAAGIDASVSFRGQDASVDCATELPDLDAARAAVASVAGVRAVSLSDECSGQSSAPSTTQPSVDSISSDGGSVAPTTVVSVTTSSPPGSTTTSASTTAPEPGVVTITYRDGALAMVGLVATEAQHAALLTAAASAVDPLNITDGVRDDAGIAITDADVDALATLLKAMTVPLVSVELGWIPDGVYVRGTYTDEAAKASFQEAADAVGVTPLLVLRQDANPQTAASTRDRLNQIVAVTPIQFAKGQITVAPESMYIVERLAGIAKSYGGVIVQVQGHTDSEGDAGRNLTLSEQRAEAVRAELVRLGVPAADITSVGFGETQLVLGANGVEDPNLSRRVVFDVTATG